MSRDKSYFLQFSWHLIIAISFRLKYISIVADPANVVTFVNRSTYKYYTDESLSVRLFVRLARFHDQTANRSLTRVKLIVYFF